MRKLLQFLTVFYGLLLFLPFSETAAQQRTDSVQHYFKSLVEVPIQFGIGYEVRVSKRLSANFQFGVLTEPHSSIILFSMKQLGAEKDVVLMIDNAFESGLVLEAGINYNFKKNYVGGFLQQISLTGKETQNKLIELATGIRFPTSPFNRNPSLSTLKSNLLQLGVLYGNRIPINLKNTEIHLELGMSMNVRSNSSLSPALPTLSERVDVYLKDVYRENAYVPSIQVAFVYTISKR
ncbi:hypothetical protein [Adhaeribacter aquaticus]|uniref:hypothetical protein n=1 Tax=Adhaeribacter aquaticus TaxID=299567 RepID=UPI00040D9E4F|nr:hypothetical protein [Adhaeribacter aquaticus]